MVVEQAAILAFLTSGAFMAIYVKLPRNIRRQLEKHQLVTEVVAMIATYWLHGATVTALLASGMVGLLVTVGLHIANHPEKFKYIKVIRDTVIEKASEFGAKLNNWATNVVSRKQECSR